MRLSPLEGQPSAVYYPGVGDRTKATAIEIHPGKNVSNIALKIPSQETYSVRGFISTLDSAGLAGGEVFVALLNSDPALSYYRYLQPVDFIKLPIPSVKYFNFHHVFPGHYIAYVYVDRAGWFYKKREVNVTTHGTFTFLDLVQ